jgi:hypothetical protein
MFPPVAQHFEKSKQKFGKLSSIDQAIGPVVQYIAVPMQGITS